MQRVRAVWSGIQGSPFLSTFYFGTSGEELAQAAVDGVATFLSAVDAEVSNALSWTTEPEVAEMTEAGQITAVHSTTAASGGGGQSSGLMSNATQGLIRLRTGVFAGGREIRGRLFVPGVTISAGLTSGDTSAGYRAALQAAADALIAYSPAAWLVWSRTNAQAPVITSASVWTEFAVLRSRRD